jgi:hydroxyacylglutathione hydrolase
MRGRFFRMDLAGAHLTVLPIGDNFTYLIGRGSDWVVIDPTEADFVIDFCEESHASVQLVVNTHHHGDHTAGNAGLKQHFRCRVAGPDDPRIVSLDDRLKDGEVFTGSGLSFCTLATPGHTRTSVCFYVQEQKVLFTGDTVIAGGCGRLFECGPEEMWASLSRLMTLPDDTLICGGHDYLLENLHFAMTVDSSNQRLQQRMADLHQYVMKNQIRSPSTLGTEKATNPFLRVKDLRNILSMEGHSDAEVFAELRRRKDKF